MEHLTPHEGDGDTFLPHLPPLHHFIFILILYLFQVNTLT